MVDGLPNLTLRGMISYDGGVQHVKGFQEPGAADALSARAVVAAFERIKKAGLNAGIFSGGGTGTYNIMPSVPRRHRRAGGQLRLHGLQYLEIGGESNDATFADSCSSLTVLTTVLNTYFPNRSPPMRAPRR